MEIAVPLDGEAASPTLVSILIPVYNVERYLDQTVRSILGQTYRELEVLLLDDGSMDGSMAVAAELAASDPRIVILPSAGHNRGVVATRNDLLLAARGAYIAWNDSDDISDPDRIARQVEFLKSHPQFGAVGTGIIFADENLVHQSAASYPPEPERQRTDPYLCCATIMATRQSVRDAGLFRSVFKHGGEDGDWILKMSDRHDVTNIPDKLYTYRRHPQSLTHNLQNWALTVRIGVYTRYAARERRAGRPDPIDALEYGRLTEQLAAQTLLDNPALTDAELLTALSRKLEGEAPVISLLHGLVADEEHARALVTGYEAQSFHSFEVVLPVAARDMHRIAPIVADATVDIRLVTAPDDETRLFSEMIESARGRYLMTMTDELRPPPPWAIHGFVERCLASRTEQSKPPRDCEWVDVTADELRSGAHHRLTLRTGDARSLLHSGTGRRRGFIITMAADSSRANIWFRTKSVYRNHGAAGVAEAVVRNSKRIGKRLAASAIYNHIGPRLFETRFGQALWRMPAANRLKQMLRSRVLPAPPPAVAEADQEAASPPAPAPVVYPMDFEGAAAAAAVKVGVYECWGDFVESLHFMTPDGTPLVDGVMFAPAEEVENPDFVLVLNTPAQNQVEPVIAPERVWFAIGEPPTAIHRPLHLGQGDAATVVTCDLSLPDANASGRRYVHAPVMTRTWHVKRTCRELASMAQPDKPRQLSWVTSNLRILDGHRYRMQFLDKLRDRVAFDLFGRGFEPIDDKWDAIAPYRYSIAFENISSPLYFTEKLMDCFVCQTMPFYFGDPEIEKRFPSKSMIRIDPEDPKVFDMIRDVAASDLWIENRAAVEEARDLVLNKYNMYHVLAGHLREAARIPAGPAERVVITRTTVL